MTHNYSAQNIGVAGDVAGQASVNVNQVAAASEHLDIGRLRNLVAQLQQSGPILSPETRGALEPVVRDMGSELQRPAPDQGKLRQLLSSVRTIFERAAESLVTSGVLEAIKLIVGR